MPSLVFVFTLSVVSIARKSHKQWQCILNSIGTEYTKPNRYINHVKLIIT